MIFASDLDRTLIYSSKFIIPELESEVINIEKIDDKPISYITKKEAEYFKQIDENILFIPTTSRTLKEYLRLNLDNLLQKPCKYVIIENGGGFLENGKRNVLYDTIIKKQLELGNYKEEWNKIIDAMRANDNKDIYLGSVRLISEEKERINDFNETSNLKFIVGRYRTKDECKEFLESILDKEKFYYSIQHSKFYIFPLFIKKEVALGTIFQLFNLDSTRVITAGDTDLDLGLIRMSTLTSFIPINTMDSSFLAQLDYPTNVLWNKGILGGQEILSKVLTINNILKKGV